MGEVVTLPPRPTETIEQLQARADLALAVGEFAFASAQLIRRAAGVVGYDTRAVRETAAMSIEDVARTVQHLDALLAPREAPEPPKGVA